jgi:hypothetical protein
MKSKLSDVKGIRKRFYLLVKYYIGRVPEGGIIPLWIRVIRDILFPIQAIRMYAYQTITVGFDPWHDVYIIEGRRFTREFLISVPDKE